VVGGHEVFFLWDVISDTQELSHAIAASVSHLADHNPIPKWHGLISGVAFPVAAPAERCRGSSRRRSPGYHPSRSCGSPIPPTEGSQASQSAEPRPSIQPRFILFAKRGEPLRVMCSLRLKSSP
jgi:hypothetical protein